MEKTQWNLIDKKQNGLKYSKKFNRINYKNVTTMKAEKADAKMCQL